MTPETYNRRKTSGRQLLPRAPKSDDTKHTIGTTMGVSFSIISNIMMLEYNSKVQYSTSSELNIFAL